jgi:hypothetical protein
MNVDLVDRATSAQKSLLQYRLDVGSAVQHAMHAVRRGFEGVYDAVRFVAQSPELDHTDLEEWGHITWNLNDIASARSNSPTRLTAEFADGFKIHSRSFRRT